MAETLPAQIEALTGSAGEILTEAGGLRLTRVRDAAPKGATSINVERCFGWPAAGKIVVGGNTYAYASMDATAGVLSGLTAIVGGAQVVGLVAPVEPLSAVTDASQSWSAIDLLRRAIMVETAEGDDLSALGRNLGVNRLPFVRTDEQLRRVIKALAYNPKATVYGLQLALDALLGAGNYSIYEDLLNFPNTVFINLPGAAFLDAEPQGKTYLTGTSDRRTLPLAQTASRSSVPYPVPTGAVYLRPSSLKIMPLGRITDCRTQLPSQDTTVDIAGESAHTVWRFDVGGNPSPNESTLVSQSSALGGSVQFLQRTGQYSFRPYFSGTAIVRLNQLISVPASASLSSSQARQYVGTIEDGTRWLTWGLLSAGAGLYSIGLINAAGAFLGGAAATLGVDEVHEITLEKRNQTGRLLVDGRVVQTITYSSSLPASSTPLLRWGIDQSANEGQPKTLVKQVEYFVETPTDYWSDNATGAVATGSANLSASGGGSFVSTDVGHRVILSNGTAANTQGGNNNGTFRVKQFVSTSSVTLEGIPHTRAQVQSASPNMVTIPDGDQLLTYPDDLGKALTLSGSALGNNGSYVIDKLYDPISGVDLSTMATKLKVSCTRARVMSASFVTEGQLKWQLDPRFVTESVLSYNLSDAGVFSSLQSGVRYLQPRQNLPVDGLAMRVTVNQVLSAQMIDSHDPVNARTSDGPPPTYRYWPFYVIDPFDFSAVYLRDIVAAGVRIQFSYS